MTDPLSAAETLLIDVSAALAAGQESPLRDALERAAAGGAAPAQVEETILQAYLFLGYPAALNAFALWREVTGAEAAPPHDDEWDAWSVRGEEVCRRVYGGQFEGLQENVQRLHPDLARWMVIEGYGKVLGRPGLELRVRELAIAALLAVLDAPRQLHSHLRGSLQVGATPEQVEAALARALVYADADARERARETWEAVRDRWGAPGRARVASRE